MGDKLTGKVAIVTGSSRGIGKAIAVGLAKEGAWVVVTGRTSSAATDALSIENTVLKVTQAGGRAIAVECDVTNEADVSKMIQKTLQVWGRIDVLVNNAGVTWYKGLLDTPTAQWNELIRTNVDGVYYCTMAVLPVMLQQRSGSIINISSGMSKTDTPMATAYAATKAAVDRLTIKLAAEVKDHGISANALEPGPTRTELMRGQPPRDDYSDIRTAEEKNIIPACIALALGRAPTGRILKESEFGHTWP